MRARPASISPTVVAAGSATFGALASMITIVLGPAIQPSFPVLFYLKFDVAEVVDATAFFVFGPTAGILTSIVHFIILSVAPGGTGPFGASLKFLAILSTFAGVLIASRAGKHGLLRTGATMTALGLLSRVVLMTIVNYAYIILLAQALFGVDYTGFAQFVLSKAGINLTGSGLVTYILGLTAIYNTIHAILTMAVSFVVVSALLTRAPNLLESKAWVAGYISRSRG